MALRTPSSVSIRLRVVSAQIQQSTVVKMIILLFEYSTLLRKYGNKITSLFSSLIKTAFCLKLRFYQLGAFKKII